MAIPTETVYGLAADAENGPAVARIFEAKGRPMDNPLIVHIADWDTLPRLAAEIPDTAVKLARAYWPGPLTMIFPKGPRIPDEVSAGLPTVAVRMPSHPVARAVIRESGLSLAAPSANRSGSPSPTTCLLYTSFVDKSFSGLPLNESSAGRRRKGHRISSWTADPAWP